MNLIYLKLPCRLSAIFLVMLFAAAPALAQKDKRRRTAPASDPSTARSAEAEKNFTEGEKYFVLEDFTKALDYFQRCLVIMGENHTGESATVHYKIAEILSRGSKQEDLLSAATSIENAIAGDKKNKYFYILASAIYASLTNYGKAEQALLTMMNEIKGTDEYLYELAALYQYDHKPEEAIRTYDRAESRLGINEVSSLQKQRIYFDLGKTTEAIDEGQKLIDTNPDDERYVLAFAETLAQNKQAPRAIKCLEDYLAGHREDGNAKLLLANIYHDAGQEMKFRELTTGVFDDVSVPVREKVSVLSAYVLSLAKENSKVPQAPDAETFARELFEKLKKAYPRDQAVHTVGGDLFMVLKKNDDAEREYRDAVRYGSTNFDAWQNFLSLELQGNKFDSIISHTEKALELFPNQGLLYYFNGYAFLRKKNYREAIPPLEQAKKLSSANARLAGDIGGLLGDAYNGAKDYAKSDKAYEDALLINPDNDLILNNYSYYLAQRKENLEKAEKMAARLIKNNPGNASYLDTYSWVLFKREKYKEALKMMEKAVDTGNVSAVIYEHYGDILFQLGNTDQAVTEWQKSKTLDSGNTGIDKKITNRRLY